MRKVCNRKYLTFGNLREALALLGGVWSLVRIQSPRLIKKRFRSHFLERFLLSMRVTFLGTIPHFYAQKREKNVRR